VIEYFITHNPPKSLAPVNVHLSLQMVASKYRTRVLAIARSISYLAERPHVISQVKRTREGNLKSEIQALRNRYGYHLGHRPTHVLLIKKGISCTAYLVRKVMKIAGFLGLPMKRHYPKSNYSPEIRNFIKGNF